MKTCHYSTCHQTGCVYIALEVVTANHSALPHLIAPFEDFILTRRIDFRQNKGGGPTDSCMSRRIRTVGRKFLLLFGIASVFFKEAERTHTHVVFFGMACRQIAGIFSHVDNELMYFGRLFFADFYAESFRKSHRHTVPAYTGISHSLIAARSVSQQFSPIVLGFVVQKKNTVGSRRRRKKFQAVRHFGDFEEVQIGMSPFVLDFGFLREYANCKQSTNEYE